MIDIQLTGLVKEFEVGKRILDGFSLQIEEGERVGLLGRNLSLIHISEPTRRP